MRRCRNRSTRCWRLVPFREKHPGALGENVVDQREFRTDRPQFHIGARRRPQRRPRRGVRGGSVMSARAHPDSVARDVADDPRSERR